MNALPRAHKLHDLDWPKALLKSTLPSIVSIALFLVPSAAQAELLTYTASLEFSGGTAPTGPTPWITVVADDGGGVGSLLLTITATNLTTHGGNAENLSELDLNINPVFNPASLVFTLFSTTSAFDLPTISLGTDAFKADGDGFYDINLMFTTGGNVNKTFTQGDVLKYTVTSPGLTALSFYALSTPGGGAGPFLFAGHIQNTGSGGTGSGWVTGDGHFAPEPASLGMAAIGGAVCLFGLWRRRKLRGCRSVAS